MAETERFREVSWVLLETNQGFLFLQRSADDSFLPGKWALPGGHIEPNETPLVAGVREFEEEAGIPVKDKDLELRTVFEIDNYRIHLFAVRMDGPVEVKMSKEHSTYLFMSKESANRALEGKEYNPLGCARRDAPHIADDFTTATQRVIREFLECTKKPDLTKKEKIRA